MDTTPSIERAMQLVAEIRIEEAIKAGKFDNLPGLGKPLSIDTWANRPKSPAQRVQAREQMLKVKKLKRSKPDQE